MSTVHIRAPVVSTICLVALFVFVGCMHGSSTTVVRGYPADENSDGR